MDNLIYNWRFYDGSYAWQDKQNVRIPNGFSFSHVSGYNGYDPDHHDFVQPEAHVLNRFTSLPPHEGEAYCPYGDLTWHCFGASSVYFDIYQKVNFPEPGRYMFLAHVFPDLVVDYVDGMKVPAPDPLSGQIAFIDGEDVYEFKTMKPFLVSQIFKYEFDVDGTEKKIGLSILLPHPLGGNPKGAAGVFIGGFQCYPVEGGGEGCIKVREQYNKFGIVFPQQRGYAVNWAPKVQVLDQWRYVSTFYTPDDASIGPDDTTVLFVNPGRWGPGEDGTGVYGFMKKYYPHAKAKQIVASSDADFGAKMAGLNRDSKFADLRPYGPAPSPPPPASKNTTGYLGIHQLVNSPRDFSAYQQMKPPVVKVVDRIDQLIFAYNQTPPGPGRDELVLVFRKYSPTEGGLRYRPDKRAAAEEWILPQANDLKNELWAAGVPTNQVVILGPNEVYEHDIGMNQLTLDLDREMIEVLAQYNLDNRTHFSYGMSSMAVGNPKAPGIDAGGELQWDRIAEITRLLRSKMNNTSLGNHCCINYHAYGICIQNDPGALIEYAPYLQNRWQAGYRYLKNIDAAIPVFMGEGGHVEGHITTTRNLNAMSLAWSARRTIVPLPDGGVIILNKRTGDLFPTLASSIGLHPGQGWNGVISEARAVDELVRVFDEDLRAFDALHRGSVIGMTPFQSGNNTDWKGFNNDPINLFLSNEIRRKYGQ